MTPTFIPATAADLDRLLGLMQEYYDYDQLSFDRAGAGKALLELLRNTAYGQAWLVAGDGDEPAGYFVLTFGYSLEFHGRDAFVDELYLRPSYRRRGLGRAVLAFAAQYCAQHGITSLHLAVEKHNHAAQAFYLAQGYVNRGQTLNSLAIVPVEGKS